MTLSKRLRFEVLRRDNHTCRYCGASAPNVQLEVDHVVPRSLGGSDRPWNLVTACHDCNGGKSAMRPDQPLIEGPSEEAIRTVRAAREVIGYLWGALPQDVASDRVRAELANRFTDDRVDDETWVDTAAWSRDLMAFAQAVHDVCDIAEEHAEIMPSAILGVLSKGARDRWLAEARETYAQHDYGDAPDRQIEQFAACQALRSYAQAAGDVDLAKWGV